MPSGFIMRTLLLRSQGNPWSLLFLRLCKLSGLPNSPLIEPFGVRYEYPTLLR